jgi:hypothetical protein
MPRFARKMALLAEIETVYGTDPVPLPAANSVLLRNVDINPIDANNVDRDLIRPYFGNSEQLVGTKTVTARFETELVGGGAAGTAPKWAPFLRSCGFAETIDVGVRVDYLPITDSIPSFAAYLFDDGVRHIMLGTRGTARLRIVSGEMPVIQWDFRGLYGPVSAQALPTPDYTGWSTPEIPTDANTENLTLGATISASGAVALTGGTPVPSLGLEVDLANDVQFVPLIGGESVDIVDRKSTGQVRLDLTAAQEVTREGAVLANGLSSIGILHGLVAGNRVGLFLPSVQFKSPRKENFNGRRLMGYDLSLIPVAGNDELRVVCF